MSTCGKRRFRDKIAAKFALSQVKDDYRRDKKEHGTYYCKPCRGWHLTSKVGMRDG